MVEPLFLVVPRDSLRFVIVVFPDHTHYFVVFLGWPFITGFTVGGDDFGPTG